MSEFKINSDWFEKFAQKNFEVILPILKPKKTLEIGSHEGASVTDLCLRNDWSDYLEAYCIDRWDQQKISQIEKNFDENIKTLETNCSFSLNVKKLKGMSEYHLSKLIVDGHMSTFDFIYIDGGHSARDVLSDLILSFKLLRSGGIILLDDYLWASQSPEQIQITETPKLAIDSFSNVFYGKLKITGMGYQVSFQKH